MTFARVGQSEIALQSGAAWWQIKTVLSDLRQSRHSRRLNMKMMISPPLQKTRLVVSSGKECRKLKHICLPNRERVPVSVRSGRTAPFLITSATRSRYCEQSQSHSGLSSIRRLTWAILTLSLIINGLYASQMLTVHAVVAFLTRNSAVVGAYQLQMRG